MNIINSIDLRMLSEEYRDMNTRGIPMILICKIMTKIKKKNINVTNIRKIDNVSKSVNALLKSHDWSVGRKKNNI
jgi:hypothetical protein